MKKIILFILLTLNLKAQNLVLNPSFEDTIPCSVFQSLPNPWQLQPTYWYSANNGSPDYFNSYYDFNCSSSMVPSNQLGYQYARTGNAYEGFGTYTEHLIPQFINRREFLGGTLIDTLRNGHEYCVEFYVSVAEQFKYLTDGVGLYLSNDSAIDYSIQTNLTFLPQISNTSGVLINDTLNWTKISGNYLANGGEKYFTIGNFKNDSQTLIDSTSGNLLESYLFLDDVSVVDCTVGINEVNGKHLKGKLYPNPASNEVFYENTLDAGQNGSLELTDVPGKVLLTFSLNEGSNKLKIKTLNFSRGVYVVKTQVSNRHNEVMKLVVK